MFCTYVLKSEQSQRRYVGSCADLAKRVARHNAGMVNATKSGVPWLLIHAETFSTRAEAVRQELHYKTGRGRDELKRMETTAQIQ